MIAFHGIFTTYGFWLPNDPRGSNSSYVGSADLYLNAGKATKTDSRRSVAGKRHDRAKRLSTREYLKFDPVRFNGLQAQAVGLGFKTAAEKSGYCVFACSILPEHVHLIVAACKHPPRRVIAHFKRDASLKLRLKNLHPFPTERNHRGELKTCWGGGGRIVYLDTVEQVLRTIRYVEENPFKEGKRQQVWSFVEKFDSHRV